jgi:hypothetical protein
MTTTFPRDWSQQATLPLSAGDHNCIAVALAILATYAGQDGEAAVQQFATKLAGRLAPPFPEGPAQLTHAETAVLVAALYEVDEMIRDNPHPLCRDPRALAARLNRAAARAYTGWEFHDDLYDGDAILAEVFAPEPQ